MEWPNRISRFGKGLRPWEGACGDKQVSTPIPNAGKCRQAFGNLLPGEHNTWAWAGGSMRTAPRIIW